MYEILEALGRYLGEALGVQSEKVSLTLAIAAAALLIVAVAKALYKLLLLYRDHRVSKAVIKNLHPDYSSKDVVHATRYFVQTQYQNVSPSEDEEPNRLYASAAKQPLVPFFINEIFTCKANSGQLFMLLAESGMGKTTFLLNLFITFNSKKRFNPFYKTPLTGYLLPFTSPDLERRIGAIQDKRNSFILLDALDEDTKAQNDYKSRLSEVYQWCREFKYVVVTCRTQFFPSDVEEPHRAGYLNAGNYPEVTFQKLYLSPFSDRDVRTFLRKRFPLYNPFQIGNYYKGRALVKKIPRLSVRPLALTFIDGVINSSKPITTSLELYSAFIDYWCERESSKPSVRSSYENTGVFKRRLYEFSYELANHLFRQRRENPRLSFNPSEAHLGQFNDVLAQLTQDGESLTIHERRSQSLLNRDAQGNYKFAHKSILEFFVAKQMARDIHYFLSEDLHGYDQIMAFMSDRSIQLFRESGGLASVNVTEAQIDASSVPSESAFGRSMLTHRGWSGKIIGAVETDQLHLGLLPLFFGCRYLEIATPSWLLDLLQLNGVFQYRLDVHSEREAEAKKYDGPLDLHLNSPPIDWLTMKPLSQDTVAIFQNRASLASNSAITQRLVEMAKNMSAEKVYLTAYGVNPVQDVTLQAFVFGQIELALNDQEYLHSTMDRVIHQQVASLLGILSIADKASKRPQGGNLKVVFSPFNLAGRGYNSARFLPHL